MRNILALVFFLAPLHAEAKKCPVRGDLFRWQMALCARQLETDDCENAALTDCVSKLVSAAGKKTECEQKKDLKKRIDDSCKKKGPCPKIPPLVANGCGE